MSTSPDTVVKSLTGSWPFRVFPPSSPGCPSACATFDSERPGRFKVTRSRSFLSPPLEVSTDRGSVSSSCVSSLVSEIVPRGIKDSSLISEFSILQSRKRLRRSGLARNIDAN